MESFGKNINLFLLDGTPTGRLICELSNWNGTVLRVPRNKVALSCTERLEFSNHPAIYFLFNKGSEEALPQVYIGETEDFSLRVQNHLKEKEWWSDVILVTSPRLNKAYIKFLENLFHELAAKANRYTVENGSKPVQSKITEAQRAEMLEFAHHTKIFFPILGLNAFEPLAFSHTSNSLSASGNEIIFHFSRHNGDGGNATGKMTDEGFVVLKGSYIASELASYVSTGIHKLRQKYASVISEQNITTADLLFSSASTAATFVAGKNINGLREWKTKDEKALREFIV